MSKNFNVTRISPNYSRNRYDGLAEAKLQELGITGIKVKKLINLSSFTNKLIGNLEKIKGRIRLIENGDIVSVRIEDLAKRLNISTSVIIDAKNQLTPADLTLLIHIANRFQTPLYKLIEFVNPGNEDINKQINELRSLLPISENYEIPLEELILNKFKGDDEYTVFINSMIKIEQDFEKKWKIASNNLEIFANKEIIDINNMEKIKESTRVAFRKLERQSSIKEEIVTLSEKDQIALKLTKNAFEIGGLNLLDEESLRVADPIAKKDLIRLIHIANQYQVSLPKLIDFVKQNEDGLNELESLLPIGERYDLALEGLMKKYRSKVEGEYTDYLISMIEIEGEFEKKWQVTTKNLDSLEERGIIDKENIEEIKKVTRVAYRKLFRLQQQNSLEEKEETIVLSEKYRIELKSTKKAFQITGLHLLGEGSSALAFRRIDLLAGDLIRGNEAVLKVARGGISHQTEVEKEPGDLTQTEFNQAQLEREYRNLKKIHGTDKEVMGLQRQLTLVRNLSNGKAVFNSIGPLYGTTLQKALFDPNKDKEDQAKLTMDQKFHMAFKLAFSLNRTHENNVTHGDVALENIFYDPPEGVFLSDFGASVDHDERIIREGINVIASSGVITKNKPKADIMASKRAYEEGEANGNFELFTQIEKAVDVFGICSILCSIFIDETPPFVNVNKNPRLLVPKLKENVIPKLREAGLDETFIKLLVDGLNEDYKLRPTAKEIFDAIPRPT